MVCELVLCGEASHSLINYQELLSEYIIEKLVLLNSHLQVLVSRFFFFFLAS